MNFDFSEDQKFLKDQARKFLEGESGIDVVRNVIDNEDVSHAEKLWDGIKEQGWLGVAIPEEYGGLGLGMLELCVIAEELGRALAPTPFSSSVFYATEAIKLAGSEEQKKKYLPKLASGELTGCYASSEGPGAPNFSSLATQLSGGSVSGTKLPVTDGDVADIAIVTVKDGGSSSLAIVDLNDQGVTRTPVKTLDPTRSHAEIVFDGATAERLGGQGEGEAINEALLNRVAVLTAFEQIGGADKCLEIATQYANERKAFGKPIGANQGIKHKLADMYVKNQVARSNAYYGAWALSTEAAELPRAAAGARLAATQAYDFAAKENIQTHGGMGFTWEVDAHLYYRRARLLALQAGAQKVWKEKLVRALELQNAA